MPAKIELCCGLVGYDLSENNAIRSESGGLVDCDLSENYEGEGVRAAVQEFGVRSE